MATTHSLPESPASSPTAAAHQRGRSPLLLRVTRVRPRRLFFTASAGWVLGEVSLLGIVCAVLLNVPTLVHGPEFGRLLSVNYLACAVVGPLLALWGALRLRWGVRADRSSLWRGVLRGIAQITALSTLLSLLPFGVIVITYVRLLALPARDVPVSVRLTSDILQHFVANRRVVLTLVLLVLCIAGEFGLFRVALLILRWWNGLRRKRLQWALTHAHLMVVVLAVALLAVIMESVQLVTSPISALRSLIPVGVVLVIGSTISIAFVFPPSVLFSYLFARRTTRRLRSLATATSALRAGDYAQRVTVEGEDEVAQLQENFNAMAAALERSVRDLEAERDRVAGLLRSRRELVASVSHELRTPVATLRGYLESAAEHWDEMPPPTLKHDLAIMDGEVARLQALIQDLFTLSRVEVGRLEMRCEPTDVGTVTRRVVATLAPIAWQVGRVQVTGEVASDLPSAFVDANRLEQVLHNLLHNALRHTPPGGIIALDTRPGDGPSENGMLLVEVRDTGEGISPEALPHVFERFYRTEASRRSPESGSGLGLALVKELTEAMGGSASVRSAPGEGSCFTLRLPLAG